MSRHYHDRDYGDETDYTEEEEEEWGGSLVPKKPILPLNPIGDTVSLEEVEELVNAA